MPCDVLLAQHRSTSSKQQKKKRKKAKLPPFSQLYFSVWCYKFTFWFVDVFRRTAEATFDDDGEVLSSTSFFGQFLSFIKFEFARCFSLPMFLRFMDNFTIYLLLYSTCWSSFLNFSETYATIKHLVIFFFCPVWRTTQRKAFFAHQISKVSRIKRRYISRVSEPSNLSRFLRIESLMCEYFNYETKSWAIFQLVLNNGQRLYWRYTMHNLLSHD